MSQTTPRFSKEAESEILNAQQEWFRSDEKHNLTQTQEDYLNSLNGMNNVAENEINLQVDSTASISTNCPADSRIGIRKEYRKMSSSERSKFHDALRDMQRTMVGDLTEYELFTRMHNRDEAPLAHGTALFLPWHREFLFRFENALKKHNPSVSVPYYDSSLDQGLPNPQHAVIWRNSLLGTNNGEVTRGSFKFWPVFSNCRRRGSRYLQRSVARQSIRSSKELLIQDSDLDHTMNQQNFFQLSHGGNREQRIEGYHAGLHQYIGGQMSSLRCSPSDPIFWMHHAFVDYIWEQFRQKVQDATSRTEYGYTERQENNGPDDPLLPFTPLRNKDGLSNKYTECYYQYEDSPSTVICESDEDCGERYFWCDAGKCRSKVTYGGDCSGLPNNACYKSSNCIRSICRRR